MDSTIILLWVFTWIAISLIVSRLVLRKWKGFHFNLGDYFSMGAILCALVRLALVHVILIWGTNNMTREFRDTHTFTLEEIHRREIASKFVLANRVFYNTYLWLQKLVLLDTYRRLIAHLRWEKITITTYIAVFAATYVTVQIVTFTECDPFNHYWIVLPDPGIYLFFFSLSHIILTFRVNFFNSSLIHIGTCCQAQLQLIVLDLTLLTLRSIGVLNVVTDLMLIALPIPVLVLVKRSTIEKLQLAVLFAVGLFIVAITIARLPQNAKNSSMQVNRTTWASVELLAAAIVSNAPVLYGLIKGRKQRSRYAASGAESSGPSRQGLQKKSVNGTQFELQGTGHGKRGSVLSSRLSSSNYLEIGSESRQSLTRSLGR
ncbi:uncharacterized protein N7469_006325 [Penicillium citrinum]|uniref:Rhodopsin domain-containing protein n=1 Tax=Penicillium citrinum TaxID=5077 RepID=A0A9W9NXV4_PENCI|nr:uncharacterized protein N7469_006325 [Penicillium citrinum]KAJ5231737.1 hypothetical protein N7469_006325 [Penicillium citrinum]